MLARFIGGYLGPIGRAVQVHLHWTVPVVLLLFAGLEPARWLGLFAVWLVHLLGKTWAVRGLGGRVHAVWLSAAGAQLSWKETFGVHGLAVVAWSGVGAQGILLLLWAAARFATGFPEGAWYGGLDDTLLSANAAMIAFGLLPLPGFVGQEAWSLLFAARGAKSRPDGRRSRRAAVDPEAEKRREETERIFQKMLAELLPPSRVDRPKDED